jgi:hypothetical protein
MQDNVLNLANPVNWAAPLNRGLLAWWITRNEMIKGRTLLDLCGRAHATISTTSTRENKVFGNPAIKNTSSGMVVSANLGGSYNGITHVWTGRYPASFTNNSYYSDGRAGSGTYFLMEFSNVSGILYGRASPPTVNLNGYEGKEVQVVVTDDGVNSAYYLNGEQRGTSSSVNRSIGSGFRFGTAAWDAEGRFFVGGYAIYSRALSAGTIAQLYLAAKTGYQQELNWLDQPWLMGVPAAVGGNRRRRVLLGSH